MMELKDVSTCRLFEELKSREGVEVVLESNPHEKFEIDLDDGNGVKEVTGPFTILKVID